jgi:DNA-binding NarL/FixJ family response regulator
MTERKLRIGLVDEHPVYRYGLAVALGAYETLEIVGEAGTSEQAEQLFKNTELDLATIDILIPGASGISLASELHDLQPSCKILGLSVIDEPGLIADMLRAHASGYALKTQSIAEIAEAITTIRDGQRYLPPSVSGSAVEAELLESSARPLERLTKRELQVFELLIRGFSNDEVAKHLQIARRTVETHRQRITHKLSSHSIAQLQRIAAREGLRG